MPKVESDKPEKLRPYLFHGIDLTWKSGDKEALGDCPWCGRENKFSVDIKTGQWRCFVCAQGTDEGGGNAHIFIRMLHGKSEEATREYEELADHRGLMYPETLIHWAICKSVLTHDWIVPGYGIDGKLTQLYRYVEQVDGKRKLLPTPTLGHQLHGVNLYDKRKPMVYLCEGPWDALVLWELLGVAKPVDTHYEQTASKEACLLASANVLAVPGCETFFESWLPLFAGKTVNLMFDSDHPRKHPNPKVRKPIPPAGYHGMERITRILSGAKKPPDVINFKTWGSKHGYNSELPSGTDIRDIICRS